MYYTYDGSSEVAAKFLSKKHSADIIQLKETKPFKKSNFGFMMCAFSAIFKRKTRLAIDVNKAIDEYKEIYLITPIWAGASTPAVNTFLFEANLEGKTVNILTLEGDKSAKNGAKVSTSIQERIEQKGGKLGAVQNIFGADPKKTMLEEEAAERIKI